MRAAGRPSSTEPRSSVLSGLAICPNPFAHFAGGRASAYLRHVCGGSGSVSSAKGGVEWRGVVCVCVWAPIEKTQHLKPTQQKMLWRLGKIITHSKHWGKIITHLLPIYNPLYYPFRT